MKRLIRKAVRGATMVEYAVLLALILVVAAAGFKAMGSKVGKAAERAGTHL